MAIKVKVSPELVKFAETMGTVVHTKRDDFMYFPFWIKGDNKKGYEIVRFEQLPQEVIEIFDSLRRISKEKELETPSHALNIEVYEEEVK